MKAYRDKDGVLYRREGDHVLLRLPSSDEWVVAGTYTGNGRVLVRRYKAEDFHERLQAWGVPRVLVQTSTADRIRLEIDDGRIVLEAPMERIRKEGAVYRALGYEEKLMLQADRWTRIG